MTSLTLAVILVVTMGGIIYVFSIINQLPPLEQFGARKLSQSTKIYDRTGETLLYEIFGEEKRTVISFEEIPDVIKRATLAAEDAGFYEQPAFDWKAIIRAFIANLKEGRVVQGGSTITQQLVKIVFLTSEKTITRKIKELILAIELESSYSKDEIFSAYLNQIPYGSSAHGIEAASQTFLNKSARELSLAEAATLSALPRAPSYYSPWGNQLDDLMSRKSYILERMLTLGLINQEEKESAEEEEIDFALPTLGHIRAPHFSLAVKSYLVNKYGEDAVSNGGLKVITTLDWELQEIAEEVVAEGAKRNEELYSGNNASLVALDPKTGQILAMVGSRDYFETAIDGNFNVATQGLRQPGSALKPFVYLTAFKKGFRPDSVVFDVSTEFVVGDPNCPAIIDEISKNNEDCFNPENFDGLFRGPVTLAEGLAQSINVPSVKTLYLAGFDDVLKTLSDFGITSLKERWRYGLSLVLGGGEVRLIELVNAYATLAQEGVYHERTMIIEIKNADGEILESYSEKSKRVFDREPTRIVNQILSDIELRSGLFQNSIGLTTFPDKEVALKTGTTDDYRDAWAVGYTPSLAIGVWAGNNNNTPMKQHGSSILAAVPIWSNFLNRVFEAREYPLEIFTRPEPRPPVNKPMLNGKAVVFPVINGKTYPQAHSILFWIDKEDPLGPIPENPGINSQFYNWEESVTSWVVKNISNFYEYNQELPENIDLSEIIKPKGIIIKNTSPENGIFIKSSFVVKTNIKSSAGLNKIELYFNQKLLHILNLRVEEYNYFHKINRPLEPQNLIEIKIEDNDGNKETISIIVFKK